MTLDVIIPVMTSQTLSKARPYTLALDTALGACSVAIVVGSQVVAAEQAIIGRGHAERLMPMVADVLARAGLDYGAMGLVGVTVGPGTFTGLRIGLAAARGLGLALDCPVVGVTTLEAVAAAAMLQDAVPIGGDFAVLHDARRGELYIEVFRYQGMDDSGLPRVDSVLEPVACPIADVPDRLPSDLAFVVGSGVDLLDLTVTIPRRPEPVYPDPVVVAQIAQRQVRNGNIMPPRPFYLRAPDAKLPGGVSLAES